MHGDPPLIFSSPRVLCGRPVGGASNKRRENETKREGRKKTKTTCTGSLACDSVNFPCCYGPA